MFGGLEIKGSASKPAANGDDSKSAAPAPAAGSSFSFMSASSPAPAAASNNDAGGSAFSFMGAGASTDKPATETVSEKKEASSVGSAFSFLTQPADEGGTKEEPSPEKPAPASSAFNFLATSAAPESSAPVPKPSPSAGSGFSFMSSPTEPTGSTDKASSSASSDPPAEKESKPSPPAAASDLLSSTTTNTHQPVGSGLVFGGAISAASKKPINRRRRTHKIGASANANAMTTSTSSMPPPSAMRPPEIPSSPAQGSFGPVETASRESTAPTENTSSSSTADAALEAARRADEFMKEKMTQKISAPPPPTPPTYSRDAHPVSPQDDDYEEAKAAAMQAQAKMLNTKKPPMMNAGGFRMPGLFKKTWGDRNSSWSSSSGKVIPEPLPSPSLQEESMKMPAAEETVMERIQREQEEIMARSVAQTQAMKRQQEEEQPNPTVPVVESRPQPPPPPPPPPSPPKKKSPKQEMQDMMDKFGRDTTRAMDRVAHLKQQRQTLLEERTAAEKKLRLATQQITQAETQQAVAVEEEDFDLADRLAAIMEKWEREKLELNRILENIGRAVKHLNEQRNDVVGAVAACFATVQTQLEEFQENQESTERTDDTKAMQRFAATSKQLSTEHERLMNDLKHIERDEALVAEERSELDSSIAEQTASVEKERLDACQKLQTVEDEIEELRERLAAREAVANQLKMEVGEHDSAIARVKLSFSRQTTRVQRKEASVKENRTEWKTEHSRYESEKEAHDEEVKAHSEALLTHDELMETLKTEISLAETFEKIVAKEVVFESATVGTNDDSEEGDDSELSRLQNKVVEGEAAVVEANQRVKAAEAVLECLDAEHKSLIARIPMLESQKKAAAGRRDFKAAGKANKEIKDATSRLKDCEEELSGEAADRVKAAKEELEQLQADLESKKAVMNEKEKEQAEAAMAELAKTIRHLISTKKKVCGNASKNSVKGVGATVLNCQIKTLQKEGETYGAKFGGWKEIIEEIYEEEEDDDSKPAPKEELESKASEREPGESSEEVGGDAAKAGKDDDGNAELSKAKISKFKELTQRLKDAEESLEAAVEREDYDEAAELDVVFQQIQTDLEELGLTDAEMDIAMAEAETGDVASGDMVETDAAGTAEAVTDNVASEREADRSDDAKEADIDDDTAEAVTDNIAGEKEAEPSVDAKEAGIDDENNSSGDGPDEAGPSEEQLASENGSNEKHEAEVGSDEEEKEDIKETDQNDPEEMDQDGVCENGRTESEAHIDEEPKEEEECERQITKQEEDGLGEVEAISGVKESVDENVIDEQPPEDVVGAKKEEQTDDQSDPGEVKQEDS